MTIKPHPTDPDKVIYFNPRSEIESIEVMRLTREGVTVSPGVSVDEAATVVLAMLDANIKLLVSNAVEEEREACAKVVETHAPTTTPTWVSYAAVIRARNNT